MEWLSVNDFKERIVLYHQQNGGKTTELIKFHSAVYRVLRELEKNNRVESRMERGERYYRSIPVGVEGVQSTTQQIRTLNDFINWRKSLENLGDCVFRGVTKDSYGIQSSAFRRIKDREGNLEIFIQLNKDLIGNARLLGHDERNGRRYSDLEILAQLQHFGAATCLIDFTKNPFIALYFACQPDQKKEKDTPEPNGKVFAVNHRDLRRFKAVTPDEVQEKKLSDFFQNIKDEDFQSSQLHYWQPRLQNNRIIAQQSVFLFGHYEFDADKECVIVADRQDAILTELKQASHINDEMLYPDFDGFARLHSEEIDYKELSDSEYRKRAEEAFQNEDFQETLINYDEVIKSDSADAEDYYGRGFAKYNLERYDEAIDDFTKSIKMPPSPGETDALSHHWRGLAKYNLERYDEAIDDFNQAIEIPPSPGETDALSHHWRGLAKYNLERYDEAIDDFNQAIVIDPSNGNFYYWRGLTKYHLRRYDEAIDDFTKSIKMPPSPGETDALSHHWRGLAKYNLERYDEAIDDFNQAIVIDPSNGNFYYWRGLTKYNLERYDEAIDDFNQAIVIDVNYGYAYYYRAKVKDAFNHIDERNSDLRIAQFLAENAQDTNLLWDIGDFLEDINSRM